MLEKRALLPPLLIKKSFIFVFYENIPLWPTLEPHVHGSKKALADQLGPGIKGPPLWIIF